MPKKVAPIAGIVNEDGSIHSLVVDGLGVAGPLTNLGATAPTLAGMQSAFDGGTPAQKAAFQSSVSGGRVPLIPVDEIYSPAELGNLAAWYRADSGPVRADWAPCADGDAVATWLDSSGNARHLSVLDTAPTWRADASLNGGPAVNFGGVSRMASPAFVDATFGNSITMCVVFRAPTPLHSTSKIAASISTATFYVASTGTNAARIVAASGLTGFTQLSGSTAYPDGVSFLGVGTNEVRAHTNGVGTDLDSSVTAGLTATITAGSVPFAGGVLCVGGSAANNANNWPGSVSEVILFKKYLSEAEFQKLHRYILRKWGTGVLEMCGNSLTSGVGSSGTANQVPSATGTNLPSRMIAALAPNHRVHVDASPGRRQDQMATQFPAYSDLLNDRRRTVTHIWEITNTLALGGSPDHAIESLAALCRSKRAGGKAVIVGTCLPRGDSGNDAKSAALTARANAILRARWAEFADALVDYAADPRLSNYNDAAYFDADKVHLNDAGYAVCRDLLLPVALQLLNT